MREIREEVTNIREMLPKVHIDFYRSNNSSDSRMQMIEKNKESQNQSLAELQQELKSLKALLLSRGSTTSSTPASPLPILGRPSIPAWQLASSPSANQSTPTAVQPVRSNGVDSFFTPSTTSSATTSNTPSSGKGKESESSDSADTSSI
jgi:hypothetical protein